MLTLAFAVTFAALSPTEKAGAAVITADVLRAHTRYLSSDLLEGRLPGTRGDALTQEYIAAQFEALGLKPGGDNGSYFQKFELIGVTGNPQVMEFSKGTQRISLQYSKEFMAVAGSDAPKSEINDAELVFVGFGIQAPEYNWDDFKGMDVKGKVLLVMNSDPEDDPALFAGKTRLWYGRWDYKYEKAAQMGAVGCIIIHTTPSAGYPWQVVQTSWAGEQFDLPTGPVPRMQVKGWATEEASRRLVAMGGHELDALRAKAKTRDFKPVPLGVKVKTQFTNTVARKQTANVLGIFPGADKSLGTELVIVTAHHDHLGKGESKNAKEDTIYNGAIDNATGVAALVSMAQAFVHTKEKPKRSVMFAAVAAEEQGLLGSQYLVDQPPVPVGRMALNVNIDGLNVVGRTKDVSVIGFGKSDVDDAISALSHEQGRKIRPDELPDRGFFYRSDQFNFAKKGVPAAYFSSGINYIGKSEAWGRQQREIWEAKHYHQPSDEILPEWDWSGAVEDVRLFYWLTLRAANNARGFSWKPGDEFEAPRRKALEALKAVPTGADAR